MRDRPGARAAAERRWGPGTYYCACAIRTKWRPEAQCPQKSAASAATPLYTEIELSVSLFDSLAVFIGSSSVGYRCINHRLKKKKMEKSRLDRFPCISVAVYFSYFGSVVGREPLANHIKILKVCACEGFSDVWRHRRVRARESTDSLILLNTPIC